VLETQIEQTLMVLWVVPLLPCAKKRYTDKNYQIGLSGGKRSMPAGQVFLCFLVADISKQCLPGLKPRDIMCLPIREVLPGVVAIGSGCSGNSDAMRDLCDFTGWK